MPWYTILSIIALVAVVLIVILIIVIKSGKLIDTSGNVGDKGFSLSLKDSNQNIGKNNKNGNTDDFINSMITFLRMNGVFNNTFSTLTVTGNTYDETYYDMIRFNYCRDCEKNMVDKINDLGKNIAFTNLILKQYIYNFADFTISLFKIFEVIIKDKEIKYDQIEQKIDELIDIINNETFCDITISSIKGCILEYTNYDDNKSCVTIDNDFEFEFDKFKEEVGRQSVSILRDLNFSKAKLTYSSNNLDRAISTFICVNEVFDSIARYIYDLYFITRPSYIKNIDGLQKGEYCYG